jgi:hypothetical protein
VAGSDDKDISTLINELWDLIVRYAKQETVDPLSDLRRYLVWGLAGAVLLAVGVPLLLFAVLRALQEEFHTHLRGNLSWVPYVAVIALGVGIGAALVRGIMAEKRRADRERAELEKRGG